MFRLREKNWSEEFTGEEFSGEKLSGEESFGEESSAKFIGKSWLFLSFEKKTEYY
jgi:hypothetical protein